MTKRSFRIRLMDKYFDYRSVQVFENQGSSIGIEIKIC